MPAKSTTDFVEDSAPAGQKSKAQILTDVYSLASQFSTCVEAFNLIHPSKDHDHAQKVALAKLGLQQGRLLIFGDAVGISAPPATIARHMIPSHPGITNPDPHLPVNFGVRDPRLDDDVTNAKIRRALHEIVGRPKNMSRDELMNVYGLKSPKSFARIEYPALDTNRLEGFREKYALLKDLLNQTGARSSLKRNPSMTTSHWTVKDTTRFAQYVMVVRTEVDALIHLMGVKEQVDRGIRSDLRTMGWHPDLTGPAVRQDWEKLRLIREACEVDYPEYVQVIEKALQYINEELKESSLARHRADLGLSQIDTSGAGARRKSDYDIRSAPAPKPAPASKPTQPDPKTHIQLAAERALNPATGKEKRPGWLSAFKLKSWTKNTKQAPSKEQRSSSVPDVSTDLSHSLSIGEAPNYMSQESFNNLETVRSKSLSAIPQAPPASLESRVRKMSLDQPDMTGIPPIQENGGEVQSFSDREAVREMDKNALVMVDTANSGGDGEVLESTTTVNSHIDRHDMYPSIGRIETKDIRNVAHIPGQ
ncbi:TPR domain containing [Pyrenophora seminiperda CCB06]|uniref:TPR domain containing n=1 Tax=Pyrenophora seminiperda CCB06 TaxID=1302712 RepID=A0A3M7MI47_9PLEO|nr:TPR domain containing [Pyrenophora seminiperda CCB06]